MRVHSPLVGVYGPSLTCRHWGFSVPPVGFVAPRVEVPSAYSVNSLHFTALLKWSTDPFQSACSVPVPMVHKMLSKQHRQTTKKKAGLPKRLMLARNRNENSMYGQ